MAHTVYPGSENLMIKFLSIARNTFTQTIRQPIYFVILFVTLLLLVFAVPMSTMTMGDTGGDYHDTDQKMLQNVGISTLLVAGLLMAAFTASGAISREIEDHTALTVVSKPVPRSLFVLGKFGGVAAAVGLAYYVGTLVFLMVVRHKVMPAAWDEFDFPVIVLGLSALSIALLAAILGNVAFRWPFISAFVWGLTLLLTLAMGLLAVIGKHWEIAPMWQAKGDAAVIHLPLLLGVLLAFLGVVIFTATAVAASTRLGQIATLLVCLAVFVIGSVHSLLFLEWGREVAVLRVLGWFAPNLTYFYTMDALASPTEPYIPPRLVAMAALYCALYTGALLAVGVVLFQHRELHADSGSSTLPGGVNLIAWAGRLTAIAAAFGGLILLSVPRFYHAQGYLLMGGLLAAGVIGWLVSGYFARGARWTYFLVAAAAVLTLASGLAGSLLQRLIEGWAGRELNPVPFTILAALGVIVLLLLVLPKTRRHFHPRYQA